MNNNVDTLQITEKNTLNSTYGRRQSWHLTSKETGHHYRPGYYFPDSGYQMLFRQPLPPPLTRPDHVTRPKTHPTTNEVFHDRKFLTGVYDGIKCSKPPGFNKVHYIKDLAEKLGKGKWRKPLTMGYQTTEYSKYGQHPLIKDGYQFDEVFNKQPFLLHDHHNDGPTKVGEAKSINPKLAGQPWYVRDKGILRELDPYISTTHKDHRRWGNEELQGYPKKDATTFWETEDYPKTRGHGSKDNPLPKDSVPREKGPMRDTLIFKKETKVGRMNKSYIHVPHTGLRTTYNDNYQCPSDPNMKLNYYCPVDTPYILPEAGTKSIFTCPRAYRTEYQNIGSRRSVSLLS